MVLSGSGCWGNRLGEVLSSGLGVMKRQSIVACVSEFLTIPTPPHRQSPYTRVGTANCTLPMLAQLRLGSLDHPHRAEDMAGEQLPELVSIPSTGSLAPLKISPGRLSRFVPGIWPLVRFHHILRLAAIPSRPLPS